MTSIVFVLISSTLFSTSFLSPLIAHKHKKRTGHINGRLWLSASRSSSRTTQRHQPEHGCSPTRTPSSDSRSESGSATGHAYSDDSQHTAITKTSQTRASGSTACTLPIRSGSAISSHPTVSWGTGRVERRCRCWYRRTRWNGIERATRRTRRTQ